MREFPKWMYSKDGESKLVKGAKTFKRLHKAGWRESPEELKTTSRK